MNYLRVFKGKSTWKELKMNKYREFELMPYRENPDNGITWICITTEKANFMDAIGVKTVEIKALTEANAKIQELREFNTRLGHIVKSDRAQIRLLKEALDEALDYLEQIKINTQPRQIASLETRIGIIGIDAETIVTRIKETKESLKDKP